MGESLARVDRKAIAAGAILFEVAGKALAGRLHGHWVQGHGSAAGTGKKCEA